MGDVLKRIIPDSDKRAEIERETKLALLEHADSIEKVRGEIILAEASSGNWLTSSWRPLRMLIVIAISCQLFSIPYNSNRLSRDYE